jgi:hypothetical protein
MDGEPDTRLTDVIDLDALLRPLEAALDASDRELAAQRALLSPAFVPDYTRKLCIFYRRNLCTDSTNCQYSHDFKTKERRFCTAFANRNCKYTGRECPYSHDTNKKRVACKLLREGKCDLGDDCANSHGPDAAIAPLKARSWWEKNYGVKKTGNATVKVMKQLTSMPSILEIVQQNQNEQAPTECIRGSLSTADDVVVASDQHQVVSHKATPAAPKMAHERQMSVAEERLAKGLWLSNIDIVALEARSALDKVRAKRGKAEQGRSRDEGDKK